MDKFFLNWTHLCLFQPYCITVCLQSDKNLNLCLITRMYTTSADASQRHKIKYIQYIYTYLSQFKILVKN